MTTDFGIFISHKHEDASSAKAVKKVLERYGGNQLQVFISTEISAGDDWFDWIRSHLGKSQLLLLLFTDPSKTWDWCLYEAGTDPSKTWDWCLYEAGMFTGLESDHRTDRKKVVCIHNPDSPPPDPLNHLQAVPVKLDKLVQFLQQLFCESTLTHLEEPLNKNMCGQPEEVERAAKDLVAALTRQPSPHPMYFGEHLVLRVQDPKGMTEENIPSDAMIVDRSNGSLALFDKLAGTWKWGDLEEEARKTLDQRWLRELAQAMHLASRGKTFDPVQATFSARRGGKVYRPILHRLDHLADGSMDFKILFEEDVSWNLKDMPTDIAVALTAQVMAIRFRYEVLQKYDSALDTIDLDDSDDSREGVFREIRHAVEMIDVEARSRGFLKKDLLAKIFDGNRERVCELFDEWCSVKTKLLESCEKKDAAETRCLIQDLLNYNTEFIPMAADYYHKLVEEALDGDKFAIPIK